MITSANCRPLSAKTPFQVRQGLQKHPDLLVQSQAQGRGVHIVGGLGTIHVIVGVAVLILALSMPHDFQGSVGNNLIGVHVGGGTRPALDAVHRKLIMQPSGHDFVTSRAYGPAHVLRQHPQAHIGQGGSLLYPSQSPDQFGHRAYGLARYVEIIQRPAGLNTVIRVRRYLPIRPQKNHAPAAYPCHAPLSENRKGSPHERSLYSHSTLAARRAGGRR